MEEEVLVSRYRLAVWLLVSLVTGAFCFLAGIMWSTRVQAEEVTVESKKKPRVVYPKKTSVDFEGASIEGELRNPGDFYFQHRPEETFDSLLKRRKNFHRELLRDVVFSK